MQGSSIAEERLGMRPDQLGVQVPQQFDLVLTSDGGDDALDGGVREGGVYVACPFLQGAHSSYEWWGTRPATAGYAAGSPIEDEKMATRSPGRGLSG